MKMKKNTVIPVWYSLFNRLIGIREYDDFNSEFSKLLSLSKKENVDEQFNDLLKRYWKRVFHDIIFPNFAKAKLLITALCYRKFLAKNCEVIEW